MYLALEAKQSKIWVRKMKIFITIKVGISKSLKMMSKDLYDPGYVVKENTVPDPEPVMPENWRHKQ